MVFTSYIVDFSTFPQFFDVDKNVHNFAKVVESVDFGGCSYIFIK